MQKPDLSDFLTRHRLPESYLQEAQQWFDPVAQSIVEKWKGPATTLIVGINGSQGSGKSTLADYLALLFREKFHLNAAVISIDDFYLTLQQRKTLSKNVHPLLATRGVPGTHDIELALDVIHQLKAGKATTLIPRFDKSADDRFPQEKWDSVVPAANLIIFEGWCLGAVEQSGNELMDPVNELEKDEDPDGKWRNYVNQQLSGKYQELFGLVDTWIMLKAPSFDCVYQWRLEQEKKLITTSPNSAAGSSKIMDDVAVKRFIQHYQRITEHLLDTLPGKVDFLFELDVNRKIINTKSSKKG